MSEVEKEADRKRIQSYIDNEIRRNQAYNEVSGKKVTHSTTQC